MKVLAITKLYAHKNKSGGELYLHHLLKEMKPKHSVSVLLPKCKKIESCVYDTITVNETNEEHWKDYIHHADIVITHLDFSAEVLDYCLAIKKKAIFILHCHIPRDIKYLRNPNVIKVFNSQFVYETSVKEALGINGKHFIVWPYTDYEKYSKYATTDLEYRQFITFINPARSKGSDVFYRLAEHFPNKKFMVVEGGYYPHLQDIRRNLGNVMIQKNTDNIIEDVYLKSRIVLQPSRAETYGMVASECRALGLPCIVNKKSPGLVENIGKIGLYGITPEEDASLSPCNIQSYIDMIKLLDHQPTYILWSNFLLEDGERISNLQAAQTKKFIDYIETL